MVPIHGESATVVDWWAGGWVGVPTLDLYEEQGYDPKLIQTRCRDRKAHPILGAVYKVNIESFTSATRELRTEEREHEACAAGGSTDGPCQPLALKDGPAEPKRDGSNSGAGSSVTSAASVAKHLKKDQALATRILAKTAVAVVLLQSSLRAKASSEQGSNTMRGEAEANAHTHSDRCSNEAPSPDT